MVKVSKEQPVKKLTVVELREQNSKLKEQLDKIENNAFCYMCNRHLSKEKFYENTNPLIKSGVTPICKECAKKIARRLDENGEYHEPTRESLIKALRYLDKPFLEVVYNSSIQESDSWKAKGKNMTFDATYFKTIQMSRYAGMTFEDSDLFKQKIVYDDEKNEEHLKNKDVGVHEQYVRDKDDIVRLIGYDPFLNEPITDQPLLYSQLIGMLDSDENANDDMLKTSSIISIVRAFSQMSKIDDTITRLMNDINNTVNNAAAIKSLQDSKQKLQNMISNLAAESCISLKNSKNAKKGENTWTGKLKRIKDLNLREYEVNGYDIETCKGMQQVSDISVGSIIKQLKLDESEYADMLAEQTEKITEMTKELDGYTEAVRILLRENLDLRDVIKENNYKIDRELIDLNEFVNSYVIHGGGDNHE